MKKLTLLLTMILFSSMAQAQTQYVEKTLLTYSKAADVKKSGKILPTTPLEVLETKGNKAYVKLTGWNKGKTKRVLYFTKGERIIQAAFSKKAEYKHEIISTEKVGKHNWSKVTIKTWIDNKELTSDINALYGKASKLFQTNCGLCHAYHPTKEFSANQWPAVIKGMLPRTPLSKEQGWLITQFAQKHAKQ